MYWQVLDGVIRQLRIRVCYYKYYCHQRQLHCDSLHRISLMEPGTCTATTIMSGNSPEQPHRAPAASGYMDMLVRRSILIHDLYAERLCTVTARRGSAAEIL